MTDEEKADRWFEEHSEDSPSAVVKALAALLRQVREEEREAIAAWVEQAGAAHLWSGDVVAAAKDMARRIRARGSR